MDCMYLEPKAKPISDSISALAVSRSGRKSDRTVVHDREMRVPGHLPRVPVGIGEIAGMAAPEHVLGLLQDRAASRPGLTEHAGNVGPFAHIIAERDTAEAGPFGGKPCILGQSGAA